jgi:hypothetical protein
MGVTNVSPILPAHSNNVATNPSAIDGSIDSANIRNANFAALH